MDFGSILSVKKWAKPSIVLIRSTLRSEEQAIDIITAAISYYSKDLENGAILSIDARTARVRLLPL